MTKVRVFFCLFVLTLMTLSPLAHADASANVAPLNTVPVGTTAGLPILPLAPLANKLGETLQTLVGVSTSSPQPAATAADASDDNNGQITDTFATNLLNTLAQATQSLKTNSVNLAAYVNAWPDFAEWFSQQRSDPHRQLLWAAIANDLLIIVGIPMLCGTALSLLLLPLRLKLKRNTPPTLSGRAGLLFVLLILRLLPMIVFLGAALILLGSNETHRLPRFVILNVIYALAMGYTIRQLLGGILTPTANHLRLFNLAPRQAVNAYRWLRSYSAVIIYGYFFIDVASSLRIPEDTIVVFQSLLGLILTVMTISVIIQTRSRVAAIIRGIKSADEQTRINRSMRLWLSRHWHSLTIIYLVIGLTVTLLGIEHGIAVMLRGTILTFIILVIARFSFMALDAWIAPRLNSPTLTHRQLLSFILRPAIWGLAALGIALTWGLRLNILMATPSGIDVAKALISSALTLFILTVLYELLNSSIERHLNRLDKTTKQPVASARARTLLPMLRNTIFILFCGIAILSCLAAASIDMRPILAGAGVVGVAVGFGSQTLVKDFLTGLFIVVENTIAVGDVVKIGEFGGVVEALSIRTLRLRDSDGSLHILPFSEVSKITNMTKGFSYALVDIGVAYDSDLERVMAVLREVGAALQEDAIFKRVILEPIEVLGVENLGDSSITIRARIRTRPGKQWDVRRLLLLRIKQRFDLEKIDIPFPTRLLITKPTE